MFIIFSTGEESKGLKQRIQRDLENNGKDLKKINNDKEDLNKLKQKVVIKKDSQLTINTINKEINKENDKNEELNIKFLYHRK